jgi:hypothetical protein
MPRILAKGPWSQEGVAVKPLLWSLNDPPERGRGDLPSDGRAVKLLRRILGLKDPLDATSGAPRQPSIVERLDDFLAHDRPDFWESFVPPKGLSSDNYWWVEELQAGPAQQDTTRLTARDGDPRRKLIFAYLSVSVLMSILGAAMIFLREDPPPPDLVGEVADAVPGGQAGNTLSGVISEASRHDLTPALQIQASAGTQGSTANRSTGLQADSSRTIGEQSSYIGVSGISEGNYGVKITRITANSPAAKAGLRVGDIITKLDGTPIRIAHILDAEIGLRKPGSKIRVSYIRNSLQGEVTVTVGKRVMA